MITRTLLAASLLISAPALAMADHSKSERIEYRTGDLNSDYRRTALVAEIHAAARRVCDAHGARDMQTLRAERQCARLAVQDGMLKLDRKLAEARDEAGTIRIAAA